MRATAPGPVRTVPWHVAMTATRLSGGRPKAIVQSRTVWAFTAGAPRDGAPVAGGFACLFLRHELDQGVVLVV